VARWAQQVENDYIGAPVGYLDPAAVMFSQPDHLLLIDSRSREVSPVRLDLAAAGLTLFLVDSGERHSTSGRIYAERVDQCRASAAALHVASLREVREVADVERLPNRLLRARARHVVTENARVHAVVDLLRLGRVAEIGPHLVASHASLRDDFEVSTPDLDLAVDSALSAGALGARMTGAGMGGCVVVLAERSRAGEVTEQVRGAFVARGRAAPPVVEVRPSAGAGRVGAS
jgi:galactokinase